MTRAAVFFALSHIVAAWLFVQQDLVASVPAFVLTGVPEGAFILLLVMVPLHLAARLVRAPSHAPTTMMMLAYIQSVAMVLVAAGIELIWTGLELVDPEFGPHARAVLDANLPLDARVTRLERSGRGRCRRTIPGGVGHRDRDLAVHGRLARGCDSGVS